SIVRWRGGCMAVPLFSSQPRRLARRPLAELLRHVRLEFGKGEPFALSPRFLDEWREPHKIVANPVAGQELDPRGEYGRFDDGILRPIEAEKIVHCALVPHHGPHFEWLPIRVNHFDVEGIPAYTAGEPLAVRIGSRHEF